MFNLDKVETEPQIYTDSNGKKIIGEPIRFYSHRFQNESAARDFQMSVIMDGMNTGHNLSSQTIVVNGNEVRFVMPLSMESTLAADILQYLNRCLPS